MRLGRHPCTVPAVGEPEVCATLVVELFDAVIADHAVFRPGRLVDLACLARMDAGHVFNLSM